MRKADYLAGRGGDELKPLFRDLQARGEQLLRTGDISAMTPYTLAYIANGAPAQWRERRLQNASRLAERLAELKGVELMFGRWPTGAVPFTLLLMFESQNERDRYQLELQRHRIYCPVHWACQTGDADATDLSFRVLSLPIDQRYGESEMDRIADVIEEDFGGRFIRKCEYTGTGEMRVQYSQPTYLPWLRCFDLIDQVDVFVLLDDVQV